MENTLRDIAVQALEYLGCPLAGLYENGQNLPLRIEFTTGIALEIFHKDEAPRIRCVMPSRVSFEHVREIFEARDEKAINAVSIHECDQQFIIERNVSEMELASVENFSEMLVELKRKAVRGIG